MPTPHLRYTKSSGKAERRPDEGVAVTEATAPPCASCLSLLSRIDRLVEFVGSGVDAVGCLLSGVFDGPFDHFGCRVTCSLEGRASIITATTGQREDRNGRGHHQFLNSNHLDSPCFVRAQSYPEFPSE